MNIYALIRTNDYFLFQTIMDKDKKKYASKGKTVKIKCRYSVPCGHLEMNRQSYRDHLKDVHKDISGDLREHGQ